MNSQQFAGGGGVIVLLMTLSPSKLAAHVTKQVNPRVDAVGIENDRGNLAARMEDPVEVFRGPLLPQNLTKNN
jgi:hypothetical protein